jgi:hypothetical protein
MIAVPNDQADMTIPAMLRRRVTLPIVKEITDL